MGKWRQNIEKSSSESLELYGVRKGKKEKEIYKEFEDEANK